MCSSRWAEENGMRMRGFCRVKSVIYFFARESFMQWSDNCCGLWKLLVTASQGGRKKYLVIFCEPVVPGTNKSTNSIMTHTMKGTPPQKPSRRRTDSISSPVISTICLCVFSRRQTLRTWEVNFPSKARGKTGLPLKRGTVSAAAAVESGDQIGTAK